MVAVTKIWELFQASSFPIFVTSYQLSSSYAFNIGNAFSLGIKSHKASVCSYHYLSILYPEIFNRILQYPSDSAYLKDPITFILVIH